MPMRERTKKRLKRLGYALLVPLILGLVIVGAMSYQPKQVYLQVDVASTAAAGVITNPVNETSFIYLKVCATTNSSDCYQFDPSGTAATRFSAFFINNGLDYTATVEQVFQPLNNTNTGNVTLNTTEPPAKVHATIVLCTTEIGMSPSVNQLPFTTFMARCDAPSS